MDIKETRAYKYAVWCVDPENKKVGRYVKKQCAEWLETADGKSTSRVDEKELKRVCNMLKVMVHPDLGVTMYEGCEDYALLFIIAVLCTYEGDKRRYTTGILEIARKNFKTFTSACIFIILMLTEKEFSRFFSVAPDYKLSSELRLAVRKILLSSPLLRDHFKINRDMITCKLTNSEYTPLAYSNDRMDGKLANAFLADEDGTMDSYPVEAMTSSQITLKNKLGIIISTQYPMEHNDFDERIAQAKKSLDGVMVNRKMFSLLYEPDDEIIKDWETDNNVLWQANPAAADKPEMFEGLIEKRNAAVFSESVRGNFLCKHCNIKYSSVGTECYVRIDKVKQCSAELPEEWWRGRTVYLGCDLSLSDDNTAVAMVTYEDGIIYAHVVGFIPEDNVLKKTKAEDFNYTAAQERGECFACGDSIIDYGFVESYILDIEKTYGVSIAYAGFDIWNARSSMQKLEAADHPIQCVEIKQHSKILHPATKLLKEKILKGEFRYNKNILLECNFSNARCTEDTNLNKYVNKKRSNGKVDMVVALINAVYLLNEYELLTEELVVTVV